jgi:hypothetical protein
MWFIPVVFFLLISAIGFQNAASGQWHSDVTEFWKNQKWHEIKALADNLDRTNRSDSETLYLAARATSIQQDHASVVRFSSRFLEKRALSWDSEKWLEKNYKPQTLLERIRLYRTRAVAGILSIITLLNLMVFLKRWNLLPWNAIISVLGTVVALI